jgi:NaMN:DMB phosphoribosyltransferase
VTMLGYEAFGLISSSWPESDNKLRWGLVESGMKRAALSIEQIQENPLLAVAAVGDPMQPFVAGLIQTASKKMPVILGGGSQMMVVYALSRLLENKSSKEDAGSKKLIPLRAPILTTKWVVYDKYVDTTQLGLLLDVPLACALVDFSQSHYPGLRSYEAGHVKEGVGAGAALSVAFASGKFSHDQILKAVEQTCAEVLGEENSVSTDSVKH